MAIFIGYIIYINADDFMKMVAADAVADDVTGEDEDAANDIRAARRSFNTRLRNFVPYGTQRAKVSAIRSCRIACIYTFKILSLFPLVQPGHSYLLLADVSKFMPSSSLIRGR